jgi:hypothetical protein
MLFLTTAVLFFTAIMAFDTGDHYDATASVLNKLGYSSDAITTVQVMNWYTDFLSTNPQVAPVLRKAHFDGLLNLKQVTSYWLHLTKNTKELVEAAVSAGNQDDFLALLGITLHAVQDFYTHSNWASIHRRTSCTCLRTDTWFDRAISGPSLPSSTFTGAWEVIICPSTGQDASDLGGSPVHGDYCTGMNKDSFFRPDHIEAYGFAYAATWEWIDIIHNWANAIDVAFVQEFRVYTSDHADELQHSFKYSVPLSEFVNTPDEYVDGHWKGPRSGDTSLLATAAAEMVGNTNFFQGYFLFNRFHEDVFQNLYGFGGPDCDSVPDPSATEFDISSSVSGQIALIVHIYSYDINRLDPSPFVLVTIDGQTYRTSALDDTDSSTVDWPGIAFLESGGSYDITIELRTLTKIDPLDSDPINFDGNTNAMTVSYNTISGIVSGTGFPTGTYNSPENLLTVSGNGGELSIYFETLTLGGCSSGTSATCSGQTPETIVGRNQYCQASSEEITICVSPTTEESSGCREEDLISELASAADMEELDFDVGDCLQICARGSLFLLTYSCLAFPTASCLASPTGLPTFQSLPSRLPPPAFRLPPTAPVSRLTHPSSRIHPPAFRL